VLRGGSWNNNQNNARAAYRNNNTPDNRNNNNGFRLVVVRRPTPYLFFHEGRIRSLFPRAAARFGMANRCWREAGHQLHHKLLLPVYTSRLRLGGCGKEDDKMAQVPFANATGPSLRRRASRLATFWQTGAMPVAGIYKKLEHGLDTLPLCSLHRV